jgi:hypothetical protein
LGSVVRLQVISVRRIAWTGLAAGIVAVAWVAYRLAVFEPYATAEIENCPDRKLYELILKEKGIPVQMLTPTRFEFKGSTADRVGELKEAYEERKRTTPPAEMPKCP